MISKHIRIYIYNNKWKNIEDVFEYINTCFPHIKSDYSILTQASIVVQKHMFNSAMIFLYLLIILPNTSPYQTKVNSKFLGFWRFSFVAIIWYTMIILEPPHHFIKGVGAGGGGCLQRQFWKFLQKVGGSDFSHKKQEVGKIGGLI